MLTGRSLARERGFTLIELLIVVAVLAILLGLALPSFSGLRRNAQDRAAQASLLTAEKLAHSIALESGEFPGTDDAVALLRTLEPAYTWNDHGVASTGPNVLSVDEDEGRRELNFAALSESGTCFFLRVVIDGETVRHKELEGDCDSHEFQDQPGSGW